MLLIALKKPLITFNCSQIIKVVLDCKMIYILLIIENTTGMTHLKKKACFILPSGAQNFEVVSRLFGKFMHPLFNTLFTYVFHLTDARNKQRNL